MQFSLDELLYLRDNGLTLMDTIILKAVAEKPVFRQDIQDMLRVTAPSLSKALTRCEAKGWVERQEGYEKNPMGPPKTTMIAITDAGRELLENACSRD